MQNKSIALAESFLTAAFLFVPVFSYSSSRISFEPIAPKEEYCQPTPRPARIEARHIEANGVGYDQGYTTIGGFFTLSRFLDQTWVPFLDLRGHIFNDGEPALNTGLGLRYVKSRVWGINAYYDYRKTHKTHYNQISVGLETLGRLWDFRINGYAPVGNKRSHFFDTEFHRFKGNHLILSRKQEFAMTGLNAEAGVHVLEKDNEETNIQSEERFDSLRRSPTMFVCKLAAHMTAFSTALFKEKSV